MALFRVLGLYMAAFIGVTLVFILLVRSGLMGWLPLFYRGVLFLTVTGILVFLVYLVLRARRSGAGHAVTRIESGFAAIMLALSLNFGFFVIIPVTIDRSVTTFMLSSMDTEGPTGGAFSKEDLRSILVDNFIDGFDAVGRRLDEQTLSGNIRETAEGTYELTEQAEGFLRFAQGVAEVYGIPDRYIAAAQNAEGN